MFASFSFLQIAVSASRRLLSGVIVLPVLLLGGCYQQGGPSGNFFDFGFEAKKKAEVKSQCATLYGNVAFNSIRSKMVLYPGGTVTRELLSIHQVPTDKEKTSIKNLENASQTCLQMHADAGLTTSVDDDILNQRASKLRYGLYKGEIPYSTYNYGMALAKKEKNEAFLKGEAAYQKARAVGGQRYDADVRQAETKKQLDSMQNSLDDYSNSTSYEKMYQTCDVTHLYGDTYSSKCW